MKPAIVKVASSFTARWHVQSASPGSGDLLLEHCEGPDSILGFPKACASLLKTHTLSVWFC